MLQEIQGTLLQMNDMLRKEMSKVRSWNTNSEKNDIIFNKLTCLGMGLFYVKLSYKHKKKQIIFK